MTTDTNRPGDPSRPVLRLVAAPDLGDDQVDAETYTDPDPETGGPADAPERDVAVSFSWMDRANPATRIPILPAWMLSADTIKAMVGQWWRAARYHMLFHLVRTPKYLVKVTFYGPRGMVRTVRRVVWWARAEQHNFALRQHAADTNDHFAWQGLDRIRERQARGRWWVVGIGTTTILVVVSVVHTHLSTLVWDCLVVGGVLWAAHLGRPVDRPILDRTTTRPRFTKLTAEMVRNALVALGIKGMTEPSGIEFPPPGVHRDGPGWLARVNLPAALEAVTVINRRGGLSSALRLPMDQVWPEPGPDHAGQLDLWVGVPASLRHGRPGLVAGQTRRDHLGVRAGGVRHRPTQPAHQDRHVRAVLPHRWPARHG